MVGRLLYLRLFGGSTRTVLARAGVLFAAIAVLDWLVVGEIPLGFLYLLPMLLAGSVVGLWTILGAAALSTVMAEMFDDLAWTPRTAIPRDVLYFAAFLGAGLFVREVTRSRAAAQDHLEEVECQSDARREAEEQLRALIESSPAAILTADKDGTVLMANEAAHRMLAVPDGELPGNAIAAYLPSLTNVARHDASRQLFRTVMQARGQRADGETFLADISFSTYRTSAGARLTAMVLDASEDLRTHEVSGLHQLMTGSRMAIAAVSHEIRNVCGAIAVVHQNLDHSGLLAGSKDFEALGNLVIALERIASVNLHQSTDHATEVDLVALLDELKIVVMPQLHEEGIAGKWNIAPGLPMVWADRSSLMQVFLNLVTNSVRAMAEHTLPDGELRNLRVTARTEGRLVMVEFNDNGGGVEHPEHLFRPFQEGAKATGLGLYLSRAFLRSFGGELRYRALPDGACFIVDLVQAIPAGAEPQ